MGRGVAVWVGCIVLLAGTSASGARGGHELNDEELQAEIVANTALAAYVARNGEPDVAESHFLSDTPPWDDHEVTLYYLDARKEIGFARAWILGRPTIHLERYERPLTDAQVAALATHVRATRVGPADRAEAAARRAEAAAGRIESAADAAERAADRAEAISTKAEGAFHRALLK